MLYYKSTRIIIIICEFNDKRGTSVPVYFLAPWNKVTRNSVCKEGTVVRIKQARCSNSSIALFIDLWSRYGRIRNRSSVEFVQQ